MKSDIIEMARQADCVHVNLVGDRSKAIERLEAFAKLVADKAVEAEREQFAVHAVDIARRAVAEEREACAKVCDEIRHPWGYSAETPDWCRGTDDCARSIRARGQK